MPSSTGPKVASERPSSRLLLWTPQEVLQAGRAAAQETACRQAAPCRRLHHARDNRQAGYCSMQEAAGRQKFAACRRLQASRLLQAGKMDSPKRA